MTFFKEIQVGKFVLRFMPSDNGWMCGISKEMMEALEDDDIQEWHKWHKWGRHIVKGEEHMTQSEQEPVAMRMPKVGDKVICIEDDSLGEVEYLTAGGSPEIKFDDGSHGTYMLREFAELFRYATTPPQRTWVNLTAEEIEEIRMQYHIADGIVRARYERAIEAKLKQKNGYAEEKNT